MSPNRTQVCRWAMFCICIGFGYLLALSWIIVRPPREPSYDGRPLHVWLDEIYVIRFNARAAKGLKLETPNAAVSAIMGAGSEAIPWLRHELRARESWLKTTVRDMASRLPSGIP